MSDSIDAPAEEGAGGMRGAEGARALAILGGGNLGWALAEGFVEAGLRTPDEITVTRRRPDLLEPLAERGYGVGSDNRAAVRNSRTVLLAVQPQQLEALLEEVRDELDPDRHLLISVVSDVTIDEIRTRIGKPVPVARAMPNLAVAIRESMTCLAAEEGPDSAHSAAGELFEAVGRTLTIPENLMTSATALCGCGIAFFLRSVRAASQGGIEIGFHPEEAVLMAAQTAKGAAGLLLADHSHPEEAIDRVTTPRGCTIAGLNEMEHQGYSSAMIKGILVSAEKAGALFHGE